MKRIQLSAIPQKPGHEYRGDTRFEGGIGVRDAREPWDTWTTAFFTPLWGVGPGEHIECLAISPDGRLLVMGGNGYWQNFRADVWDLTANRPKFSLQGHTAFLLSAGFSPDGRRIVTSSWDGTAKL